MLFRSEGAEKLELSMPWVSDKVYARSSRVEARLGKGDGKNEKRALVGWGTLQGGQLVSNPRTVPKF